MGDHTTYPSTFFDIPICMCLVGGIIVAIVAYHEIKTEFTGSVKASRLIPHVDEMYLISISIVNRPSVVTFYNF